MAASQREVLVARPAAPPADRAPWAPFSRGPLPRSRSSPLLEGLFPHSVAAREIRGGCSEDVLYAEEARHVERAVRKRRAEFAAGRACAREAMACLGIPAAPLAVDADRSPIWPATVVGSITHTEGFCGAVVALSENFSGIGVDAERRAHLEESLWPRTCTSAELRWLRGLSPEEALEMATLIFSAKEAFYKAQYPNARSWLDFHDVTVRVSGEQFLLEAPDQRLLADRFREPWVGQFRFSGGLVVSGIALAGH